MIKKWIYSFGALVLPLLVVWIFRMQYGYIYHAVDDVTINYSIINGESMLLPYIGIVLTKILVLIQNILPMINIYFIFIIYKAFITNKKRLIENSYTKLSSYCYNC